MVGVPMVSETFRPKPMIPYSISYFSLSASFGSLTVHRITVEVIRCIHCKSKAHVQGEIGKRDFVSGDNTADLACTIRQIPLVRSRLQSSAVFFSKGVVNGATCRFTIRRKDPCICRTRVYQHIHLLCFAAKFESREV